MYTGSWEEGIYEAPKPQNPKTPTHIDLILKFDKNYKKTKMEKDSEIPVITDIKKQVVDGFHYVNEFVKLKTLGEGSSARVYLC